jgi:hypothetical protein
MQGNKKKLRFYFFFEIKKGETGYTFFENSSLLYSRQHVCYRENVRFCALPD